MNPARNLLVDDEPDMLENCSRILSRQAHTSLTAANGRAALVALEQEHPDLLVTDLRTWTLRSPLPGSGRCHCWLCLSEAPSGHFAQ